LRREVNMVVASCHHALPWHKAKGDGARQTPTTLRRVVNMVVSSYHHALPWHKAKGGGARRTPTTLRREVKMVVASTAKLAKTAGLTRGD
jgi:hypothetical protein